MTGDCNPCPSGTYGVACSEECSCSSNGTALCYHENGNCFCKTNYYGRKCEMLCPFGYLDGVCHKEPLQDGFCSCASDLYRYGGNWKIIKSFQFKIVLTLRCDKELGCVCKDGFDCEGGTQIIDFASLTGNTDSSSSHTQAVSIVAAVLILAIIITVLIVVYYRRRMNRLQKDLQNRSVLYVENSVLTPDMQARKADLVIRNVDPYDEISSNRIRNNVVQMATASSSATATVDGAMAASPKPEKNVNIDRFKLGMEEQEGAAGGGDDAEAAAAATKAKVLMEDEEGDDEYNSSADSATALADKVPFDINLYEEYSPSKEKNNAKLADLYYKKNLNKENINVVLNNIDGASAAAAANTPPNAKRDEDDDEEDSDDLKAHLNDDGEEKSE